MDHHQETSVFKVLREKMALDSFLMFTGRKKRKILNQDIIAWYKKASIQLLMKDNI